DHPASVRLDVGDLSGRDPAQPRDLVRAPTPLELIETRQLAFVRGDDQLALSSRLDPPLVAIGVEPSGAVHTEPCLERARRVVDPGVDHAARMGRLVRGEPILSLEDAEAGVRVAAEQLSGDGEAEDAPADH